MLLEIIDLAKYANCINDFVLYDKAINNLFESFDKCPNEKDDALVNISWLAKKYDIFKNDERIIKLLKKVK